MDDSQRPILLVLQPMDERQPAQGLGHHRQRQHDRDRVAGAFVPANELIEVAPADVRHREVRDVVDHRLVEDLDDVRVLEARHQLGLDVEHRAVVGALRVRSKALQHHQLLEALRALDPGQGDLAHAATIDDAKDLVLRVRMLVQGDHSSWLGGHILPQIGPLGEDHEGAVLRIAYMIMMSSVQIMSAE